MGRASQRPVPKKRRGRRGEYLLVDLSNSYTKVALASRDRILARGKTSSRELTPARFHRLIESWDYEFAVVCSVVPQATPAVHAGIDRPTLQVNHRITLGVKIDFPSPRSIGADRLANAAGVAALYGAPAVVIDFGTAVTFDIVSKERAYIGGVIAPGLEVMTSYLYERTALLPRINLSEPREVVGRSTRAAMISGAVYGYRGLVREILGALKREVAPRGNLRVLATGGYARLIASRMPEIDTVDPDLTLHGLRVIGNLNAPLL